MLLPLAVSLALACALSPAPTETGWNRFRGPNGSGVIRCAEMPRQIAPGEHARWRTPIKPGFSSPVLAREHLFLTGYEGTKLFTICVDRESGEILWERVAPKELPRPSRGPNSPVSPTPVTDGENVYCFFGNFGLVSYSASGKERWRVPLGPFKNPYGMANSPILAGDLLVLQADQDTSAFLLALDKDSGKQRWKVARPRANHGFSTPIVYQPPEGPSQIIVLSSFELCAYASTSGEKLWWVNGMAWQAKSTPVLGDGVLYVHSWMADTEGIGVKLDPIPSWKEVLEQRDANEDGKLARSESPDEGMTKYWFLFDLDKDHFVDAAEWDNLIARSKARTGVYAIRLGGRGDVTASHVIWRYSRSLQNVPSPLLYEGVLYLLKEGGILTALDPASGKVLRRARVGSAPDTYYASPVAAGGAIYTASHSGIVTVLQAGKDWQSLHSSDFEEAIWSTPALAPGRIYLRTQKALYCFAP